MTKLTKEVLIASGIACFAVASTMPLAPIMIFFDAAVVITYIFYVAYKIGE